MIVIANRPFKYAGRALERGQELDIEDSRLASRLVRTRYAVEPDRTNVEMQLVVTHRPAQDIREEVDVVDENGRPVVDYEIMEGAVGRPRRLVDAEQNEVPRYRYRKQTRTTTKRGFEWFGEWLSPGDVFPEDGRLTAHKRRNLIDSGWIREEPKEKPKGTHRGRPRGSKNKKN